jgi:hypothetical protein
MRRLAVVVSVVVLFGGLGATAASAQTADAVSVARALIAAENAHDVPAAVALFAPGAIVVHATGQLASIAEITDWQRELAAGNFHAEITTPVAVTPEVVTFSGNVSLDSFRSLGISTLDANWQLTVALGRVTTFSFDFTPAATARLLAAIAGAGAATAGAGASSGGGGSAASTTPAAATAVAAIPARTLALTGADSGTATAGGLAVLLGLVLLGLARRPGASQS